MSLFLAYVQSTKLAFNKPNLSKIVYLQFCCGLYANRSLYYISGQAQCFLCTDNIEVSNFRLHVLFFLAHQAVFSHEV